jgi:hypothetical protein
MKKQFLIIISFYFSLTSFAQKVPNHLRWMQYGIEIITEENISVIEEDLTQFRCDGLESNLWISKTSGNIPKGKREEYLMQAITDLGFRIVGRVKEESADSINLFSARAENNKNYGYIFLLTDTLANNNQFIGYLTTGSKPKADIMKLIEFRTFKGDINYKALASKSAQTIKTSTDTDHYLIKESNNSDTLVFGRDNIHKFIEEIYQKYSPVVTSLIKTYYSLPEKLGARNIGTHIDFAQYFKDTLNKKDIYFSSTFAHETLHNVDSWLSVQQSIKKTRGNYSDKIFSYYISDTCKIDVDRISVPPANIINRSFPVEFKTNTTYPLYIYPSSLTGSTQINGIYILMDEFAAYNIKILWLNDILQYYFDNKMTNVNFYLDYLNFSHDMIYTSACFKHYIIHYLLTLRSSSPDLYNTLMGNENFKKVIALNCKNLNKNIEQFNQNKSKIREELANEYIPYIEDYKKLSINGFWYENKDLENNNKLCDLLNSSPDYQNIIKDLKCDPCIPILMIKD